MQSNQNGYFFNVSIGTRETRLWEWKRWFEKPFCLVFSSEIQIPPLRIISKYNAGHKIRTGTLESIDVSSVKKLSSTGGSAELVQAMTGGGAFSNADHIRTLTEKQLYRKKDRDTVHESILKGLLFDLKVTDKDPLPTCQKHRCLAECKMYYSCLVPYQDGPFF